MKIFVELKRQICRKEKEVIVCIIPSLPKPTMMTNYTKLTLHIVEAIGVQRWGIMKPVFNMRKATAFLPHI